MPYVQGESLRDLLRRRGALPVAEAVRLADVEAQATAIARRASANAEAYVRENPWTVAGGALATGLVLGAAFMACLRSASGDRAVS